MKNISRETALAFRLGRLHLKRRQPARELTSAATYGLQNTVPGGVALMLAARIENFESAMLEEALLKKKSLVEVVSLRGGVFIVPREDALLFSQGILPESEDELRPIVGPAPSNLKSSGISATEAVKQVSSEIRKILKGRALSQDQIHAELKKRLPKTLLPLCRPCDSHHVQYSLMAATGLLGDYCFGPYIDKSSAYVLLSEWLPGRLNPRLGNVSLAHRYLRAYGPSTASAFAAWAGLSKPHGKRLWQAIEDELSEVSFNGESAFILRDDLKDLSSAKLPKGVRLIPPYDPLLQFRDRETLVHDPKKQKEVWKALGNPGVVLQNGEITATWRPQKKGKALVLTFQSFQSSLKSARTEIEREAETVMRIKGCSSLKLSF